MDIEEIIKENKNKNSLVLSDPLFFSKTGAIWFLFSTGLLYDFRQ